VRIAVGPTSFAAFDGFTTALCSGYELSSCHGDDDVCDGSSASAANRFDFE